MQNWQFHEELKQLNKQSYSFNNRKVGDIVKGNKLDWRVEAIGYDPKTNFKAIAYSNGKNLVFSFVGTKNTSEDWTRDWTTNIKMHKYAVNKQFTAGEHWVQSVIEATQYRKYLKYTTGHSEGGSEALLFGKKYGLDTVTFNAYNVRDLVETSPLTFSKNPQIINYGISNDLTFNLTKTNHLGQTYIFGGPTSRWGRENNLAKSHSLNIFPSLDKAQPYDPQAQYIYNGRIEKIPVNWQKYLNQNKAFTRLQPSKISDEINQPVVQGISGAVADASISAMNIIQPRPIVNTGAGSAGWLGQLGNILSLAGQAVGAVAGVTAGAGSKPTGTSGQMSVQMGSQSFTSESFPLKHTGGKISGRDEVMAILRGGETVRTEAQEQELQEEKYKQFMEAIRPYLEERESKPKSIAEAYDPENKIPCLLNKTTQDEELIISIIAQAWKSNRLGFRNVLRYE